MKLFHCRLQKYSLVNMKPFPL